MFLSNSSLVELQCRCTCVYLVFVVVSSELFLWNVAVNIVTNNYDVRHPIFLQAQKELKTNLTIIPKAMAERVTTKEALKKLDAQLECSLCLDTFKQPKLLPCFHVFCKSPCLEKLVTKDGRSLTCPTCRHIVPLSERGVAGLQSDFHIDHLFEIQDAFNKAEDDNDKNCGSCENGRATGYCNDCGDFLCDRCQTAHKFVKLSKNHKLISLDELKAQVTSLVPPKKAVPHCPKHSENVLKIYCDTCSTLICMDCTIRIHKDHNYDLVADVLTKHKEELVSSLKPVKEKLDSVQRALKDFDTRAKAIHNQRAAIEANIHKEIDEQHRLLDQRRTELVGELEMLTQQKLKDLAAQRDQVEITQVKLTSCLEYTEGGLKTGTDGEVLEMKSSVIKRVEHFSTEFESNAIQPETRADIELITKGKEPLQQAYRNFLQIDHSGSFSLENSHTTGNGLKGATTGETKTVSFQAMTKKNKKSKNKLDLKAELVHIESKDKSKCEVVVVRKHGQYKINYHPMKRGKHELHITVNGDAVRGSPFPIAVAPSPQSFVKPSRVVRGVNSPRGTVSNNKGQLVVVEGGGATVSVLTPEGENIRTFGKLSNAHGVTVDKDNNMYVMEYGNHRVNKFSSDGEFVAAVGSPGSGNLQFTNPVGICYNRRDNDLYVVDQCNHRIQVLSTDLTFIRCFGTRGNGNGQLQSPLFAAFDSANNLYVTDHGNHRVQVFTAEGQFLGTFSQKANGQKLSRPYAIAIDSSDTVYVSENGPHHVSVFTSQGAYITTFGGPGTKEGQFYGIYGLSIDRNDSVVVSDLDNGRLQIF
ncbi:tripartite motif-containing protein 3-like [Halichondria panicea]|uniref:tripartite motif-containing protein 3-like n=1 Tax=Halichondria panicea TaxID=6063 RepID=UPI00312B7228